MNERKILLFILSLVIYCLYSAHMWFMKGNTEEQTAEVREVPLLNVTPDNIEIPKNRSTKKVPKIKEKVIPLYFKNACSVLEIFTRRPPLKQLQGSDCNKIGKKQEQDNESNKIAAFAITLFLLILAVMAVLDVLQVKEEERIRRKMNPDGERRQSLAEFANKKTLRREPSRFGLQLFQIAESPKKSEEEKKDRRLTRLYTRGDSTNSYLSERKTREEDSAPASIGDTSEPKLVKRQSVAKLFGARPVPMVRRSSFPALPLNPDIQAMMLSNRQSSFDSDDEGEGKGRRVRLIRRF